MCRGVTNIESKIFEKTRVESDSLSTISNSYHDYNDVKGGRHLFPQN